jgi:hypothetical protein
MGKTEFRYSRTEEVTYLFGGQERVASESRS